MKIKIIIIIFLISVSGIIARIPHLDADWSWDGPIYPYRNYELGDDGSFTYIVNVGTWAKPPVIEGGYKFVKPGVKVADMPFFYPTLEYHNAKRADIDIPVVRKKDVRNIDGEIYANIVPHSGLDFSGRLFSHILAADDGEVIDYGEKASGKYVAVYYPRWNKTAIYLHLAYKLPCAELGAVKAGDIIGYLGQSGIVWEEPKLIPPYYDKLRYSEYDEANELGPVRDFAYYWYIKWQNPGSDDTEEDIQNYYDNYVQWADYAASEYGTHVHITLMPGRYMIPDYFDDRGKAFDDGAMDPYPYFMGCRNGRIKTDIRRQHFLCFNCDQSWEYDNDEPYLIQEITETIKDKIEACKCASENPLCDWCDSLSEFRLDEDDNKIRRTEHSFEIEQFFEYTFHFDDLSGDRGYNYYWSTLDAVYQTYNLNINEWTRAAEYYGDMGAKVYWYVWPKRVVESPGDKEPEKEQKTKKDAPWSRDMVEMRTAPNPFTNIARISILVKEDMVGEVAIYNVGGKELAHLYSGELGKGVHVFGWQPEEGISSGTYFIKFTTRDFQESQRVVYIR